MNNLIKEDSPLTDFMPLIPKELFLEFIMAAFLEGRMEDTSLEDYLSMIKKQYNIK